MLRYKHVSREQAYSGVQLLSWFEINSVSVGAITAEGSRRSSTSDRKRENRSNAAGQGQIEGGPLVRSNMQRVQQCLHTWPRMEQ